MRAMTKLSITLLGRLRVSDGAGNEVAVPGRKQQALLVFLALNAGRPQSRDALATLLWGDRFDEQARHSLRQCISKLRKALGNAEPEALLTDGNGVALNANSADVDTRDFEQLAAEGTPQALARAAGLYGGGLIEGLDVKETAFEDWIAAERARFNDLACEVLAKLGQYQAAAGDTGAAIDTARRLVALDPLNEEGHRALIRLFAETGRRAQALKQYQALTKILDHELGVKPESETQRLYVEIRGQDSTSPPIDKAPEAREAPPVRDKPTIAVLPFNNMSGDADQEYFVNGITEDIITALTKNRWLSVISRNSTFGYKGQSPDVRRVGDELGAEYVVEGSVRKSGKRVRITAQLIDAVSGKQIWAERYDRDLKDIFTLQDEFTETIAARIEPELAAAQGQRVKRKPTENLDAWDCYHLGLAHMYNFNTDDNVEAQRLFRRAIKLDPDFAPAHARLAYSIIISMVYFDAEPTAELLDHALRTAQKSAALDDQDAVAHFAVGRAHLARCEYVSALAEYKTATELNPCLAQAHCGLGDALAYMGQLEESISHFEEAIRLSPHDPYRWGFFSFRSLAHLFFKQHELAAKWAAEAIRAPNSQHWSNANLVAALGHSGQPEEIRAAIDELLRRKPEFSRSFARHHLFYIKDSAQMDHYLDGLRKAGVPE